MFPAKIVYTFLLCTRHMPNPLCPPQFYPPTVMCAVQIMKLLVMQSPPVSTSSLLVPNSFLSALFSDTVSHCSLLDVRGQVSHPYKTTDKGIF